MNFPPSLGDLGDLGDLGVINNCMVPAKSRSENWGVLFSRGGLAGKAVRAARAIEEEYPLWVFD
jgi:hypothetical protein